MSDTAQVNLDLDTLTDDEVMNLGPDQVQALMDQEGNTDVVETNEEENNDEPNPNTEVDTEVDDESNDSESNNSDGDSASNSDDGEPPSDSSNPKPVSVEEQTGDGTPDSGEQPEGFDPKTKSNEPQKPKKSDEKEPEKAKDSEKESDKEENKPKTTVHGLNEQQLNTAVDFFKKVSAPFKADGKEIQVRTPEDAVRLMQMGVNYSRRMQEMKPLRALDHILTQHGLKDPAKLSELIDISKGNPKAIEKLLKEKGIDPLDFDTSKDNGYKAPNYQGDPKDLDFKEAIDNTLSQPGGRELIADVNNTWDSESKSALRDQPAIFQNLLEQKNSGVYGKIIDELNYQRTMGYLTNVPFLQAYHQVGDAMQKAGVFSSPQPHSGGAEMKIRNPSLNTAPIDTGPRKAVSEPKTTQPNPSLSSAQPPRSSPSNGGNQEPDYATMSDEEFLKLGIPS